MRKKRIFLLAAVALGLAPGTFVRSEVTFDYNSPVTIRALGFEPADSGPLSLAGVWQIASLNDHVGGYSALVALDDDTFLAASDAGRLLEIARPDRSDAAPRLEKFSRFRDAEWMKVDVEALARDPGTGQLWIAIESLNRIVRFGKQRSRGVVRSPKQMADWPENAGPESMVRLADGRFIIIAEAGGESGQHSALLYARDPLLGGKANQFTVEGEGGYNPSDATQMPDGRILVILRAVEVGFPIHFPVKLAVFDPREIAEKEVVKLDQLARIDTPFPSENYEGVLVTQEAGGDWSVWLIADDNFSRFQRTLLLKLDWKRGPGTRQKARR